jgi:hypothetical protein
MPSNGWAVDSELPMHKVQGGFLVFQSPPRKSHALTYHAKRYMKTIEYRWEMRIAMAGSSLTQDPRMFGRWSAFGNGVRLRHRSK